MRRSAFSRLVGLTSLAVALPLSVASAMAGRDAQPSPRLAVAKNEPEEVQLFLEGLSVKNGGFTDFKILQGDAIGKTTAYEMASDTTVCLALVVGVGVSATCTDIESRKSNGLALSVVPVGSRFAQIALSPPDGAVAVNTPDGVPLIDGIPQSQIFVVDASLGLDEIQVLVESNGVSRVLSLG